MPRKAQTDWVIAQLGRKPNGRIAVIGSSEPGLLKGRSYVDAAHAKTAVLKATGDHPNTTIVIPPTRKGRTPQPAH